MGGMPRLPRSSALAVAALLVLLPVPAHAERWSSADAEADVTGWHWDPEPAPCGTMTDVDGSAEVNEDITRLGARHTTRRLWLVTRFRDLDEALDQHVSYYLQTPRGAWDLDLDRDHTRSGRIRVTTFLARAPEPEPAEPDEPGDPADPASCWSGSIAAGVRCAVDHDIDFDSDTVALRLPRSCVGSPRWVRVGVSAYSWPDSTDPATEGISGFSDAWGVPADGEVSLAPPVGPRLRASAASQSGSPSNSSWVASSSTASRRSLVTSRTGLPIGTTAASAN